MTTPARDGQVFDFVPARPAGPRLLPDNDDATWSPGDRGVLPEPVLGAAVPLLFEADPFSIEFFERVQPRSAFTLSWWVKCDWKPWADHLETRTWDPYSGRPTDPESSEPAHEGAVGSDEDPLITISMVRRRSRRTEVTVAIGAVSLVETVDIDTPSNLDIPGETGADTEDWHHLAVTFGGKDRTLTLFLDGTAVGSATVASPHLNHARRPRVVIDGDAGERKILWLGPVRLHDRARTAAELVTERHYDRATYPTVDQRNPLAFRLADANDDPAIYITDDDIAGRTLHLVVENRSRFPVELPRRPGGDNLDDCLEFRFRPGCLAGGAEHWVEPHAPSWQVASTTTIDGGLSLFVGRVSPLTLDPGCSAALTLHHVRADGTLGAHGTHVELVYPHPHHPELRCTRLSAAEVRGQRGRRHSPLRLAVLDKQVVVNDGQAQDLRLSVINTSATHPVEFSPPIRGYGSRLILSIDSGEPDHHWALATTDQLLGTSFEIATPGPWTTEVELFGNRPQWTFTPTRHQVLEPGRELVIAVGGLKTEMRSGHSRAELRLENIGGYWDDHLRTDIEKSRIVTDDDDGALDVDGDLTIEGDVMFEGTLSDRHGELLPGGVIVMWHGRADQIPDGWLLCDGKAGSNTPDLSDKFIRGSKNPSADPDKRTGGQDTTTLTTSHLPTHSHEVPGATISVAGSGLAEISPDVGKLPPVPSYHRFRVAGITVVSESDLTNDSYLMSLAVLHEVAAESMVDVWGVGATPEVANEQSFVADVGEGKSFDNRPVYYDLCFIMKQIDHEEGS